MKKTLMLATGAVLLVALGAIGSLALARGATGTTVRTVKTYEIPYDSYAHAVGTNLYCEYLNTSTGLPAFDCYVFQKTGSKLRLAGNHYAALIASGGVVVTKTNAAGTSFDFTKSYG